MTSAAGRRLEHLLAPRCVACREVLPDDAPFVNFGDLQFHLDCRPACTTCARSLLPGEGGWRSEGRVVSEVWGYSVRPDHFWCPECLGMAPREAPRGSD